MGNEIGKGIRSDEDRMKIKISPPVPAPSITQLLQQLVTKLILHLIPIQCVALG